MHMSLSDECKTFFQTTFPYICFSFVYIAQVNLAWEWHALQSYITYNPQKIENKET